MVYRHSGYPGGIKTQTYADLLGRKPAEAVRRTIRGMLPKNRLGRQMLKKLKVYAGPTHPHAAQQPAAARASTHARRRLGAARRDPSWPSRSSRPPVAARRPWPASASAPAPARSRSTAAVEDYFPSETHRMILTEPLRLTETEEAYDIDATIDGGGVSGQAGALRLGIARALVELDPELRPGAQAGRLPHPRRPREGVQEVRPEEGPQGSAVLQAVMSPPTWRSVVRSASASPRACP